MAIYETTTSTVPPGVYRGTLESVEQKEFNWGDRLIWSFRIQGGDEDGLIACAFSGTRPGVKTFLCKYLASLEGETPKAGIKRNPDEYTGRQYSIVVSETDSGDSKVTAFTPWQEGGGGLAN